MSIESVLLILILGVLAYISIQLPKVLSLLERIAGVSHYPQQSAYNNTGKIQPVLRPDKATVPFKNVRRPETSPLVNLEDLSDEEAISLAFGAK